MFPMRRVSRSGDPEEARELEEAVADHGLRIAVVGLPKTIDNDIRFIDRSFGYETAYSIAVGAMLWVGSLNACRTFSRRYNIDPAG